MKVKIKIMQNDCSWPSQFWGQEVEVQIDNVTFPDGMLWNTTGLEPEVCGGSGGGSAESIRSIVGQDMTDIHINFR